MFVPPVPFRAALKIKAREHRAGRAGCADRQEKKALIIGVSGQDGALLSNFLLENGYTVVGTSRDAERSAFPNLETLGIRRRIETISMSVTDIRDAIDVISRIEPDEVYNLSGQSSVALSFSQPTETFVSTANATLNLLEALRVLRSNAKFYNAASSERFGDTGGNAADESTPFQPRSPYGVGKSAAFWHVANYRDSYGLFACSGILFNHESFLRPERFITRKIVNAACDISKGRRSVLEVGNIDIERDWGWAPEYVEAMWKILQASTPGDFVIATGASHRLSEFISHAFSLLDLDWRKHLVFRKDLFRPSDIMLSWANPDKARSLKWIARSNMYKVVEKMINWQLESREL
jgi:GDPmannose 4,6-dehydratase